MIHSTAEYKRFQELTPFYVNATLDQNDMAFVQQYLGQHPELQVHIDLARALQSAIIQQAESRPIDAGLNKMIEAFRQQQKSPNLIERLRLVSTKWGFTKAFAAALALVLVQFAVILQLQFGPVGSAYRGLGNQSQNTPHLKVIINPQTNYADLVVVLRANGCRVVSGPSETGELWLSIETPEKINKIKEELMTSGLVDQVISTHLDDLR